MSDGKVIKMDVGDPPVRTEEMKNAITSMVKDIQKDVDRALGAAKAHMKTRGESTDVVQEKGSLDKKHIQRWLRGKEPIVTVRFSDDLKNILVEQPYLDKVEGEHLKIV